MVQDIFAPTPGLWNPMFYADSDAKEAPEQSAEDYLN